MRLVWHRTPQPQDEHALALTNPEAADVASLRELFAKVQNAQRESGPHLSRQANAAFEEWLKDVARPLPSHFYAWLSGWFPTGTAGDRDHGLAHWCAALWDLLFCVRPATRLTPPIADGAQITNARFSVWWDRQEQAQRTLLASPYAKRLINVDLSRKR